ncbi:hypothetical protein LSH36_435g00011 [Paralvinella palmiformis]|uniref:Uncharacterized protein n=1 Tax=Paralvinella palmiformis TaxID=53620 RepID=A0AAD9JCB8_9ANNE|nr:hypothetical protein LSH36_435g00011 [Paralvinella palmiformis]
MKLLVLISALIGCVLAAYEKPAVVKKHVVEKTVYKSVGYGGAGNKIHLYHGNGRTFGEYDGKMKWKLRLRVRLIRLSKSR